VTWKADSDDFKGILNPLQDSFMNLALKFLMRKRKIKEIKCRWKEAQNMEK
jgi:hypothetical protein